MEEQLISSKTAKLAKKVNFYLGKTLSFSKEDGSGTIYFGNNVNDSDEEIKRKYLSGEFTDFEGNPVYLIVTQSLLQKWLRKNHNIYVCVYVMENLDGILYFDFGIKQVFNWLTDKSNKPNNFKTYKEALEVGLQEGLKLI